MLIASLTRIYADLIRLSTTMNDFFPSFLLLNEQFFSLALVFVWYINVLHLWGKNVPIFIIDRNMTRWTFLFSLIIGKKWNFCEFPVLVTLLLFEANMCPIFIKWTFLREIQLSVKLNISQWIEMAFNAWWNVKADNWSWFECDFVYFYVRSPIKQNVFCHLKLKTVDMIQIEHLINKILDARYLPIEKLTFN